MKIIKLMIFIGVLTTTGCASLSSKACVKKSCSRPTSSADDIVIWWSPDMRYGPLETSVYGLKEK